MLDEMRMRTVCFARVPQRCTSRLSKHFLLTFQEVTPLSKTRNQLYGSGSVWSAPLAARMLSVLQTVLLWGLNPHHWLSAFLQACADHGGTCPPDLRAFLPWQMTPERREELTRPGPVRLSPLTAQAQEGDETAVVNTS